MITLALIIGFIVGALVASKYPKFFTWIFGIVKSTCSLWNKLFSKHS